MLTIEPQEEKKILDSISGNTLTVLYKPNLASHLVDFIKTNLSSKEDMDENSHQYDLFDLADHLECEQNSLSEDDNKILTVIANNFDYLEL